jgi:hypothetical protein
LALESQLESKRQPILAKYKRMTAAGDDNIDRTAGESCSRKKRAAALSAQTLWRNFDNDEDDNEFDDDLIGIERRTRGRVKQTQRLYSPQPGQINAGGHFIKLLISAFLQHSNIIYIQFGVVEAISAIYFIFLTLKFSRKSTLKK